MGHVNFHQNLSWVFRLIKPLLVVKKFVVSLIFNVFFWFFWKCFNFWTFIGFNWEVSHMLTWKSERCHLFLKNLLELLLKQRFLWRMRDDWLNMSFRNLWPMNCHCSKQFKTSTLIAWWSSKRKIVSKKQKNKKGKNVEQNVTGWMIPVKNQMSQVWQFMISWSAQVW